MAQFLCNQSFRANLPISSIEKSLDIAIKENILEQLILIVPTGRLVRFLKNQITRKYFEIHKKPSICSNIYTLQSFITQCFEFQTNKNKFRIISDGYQLALFEEAVKKAELNFFAGKEGKVTVPTIARIAKLIYGLKEDGITPSELQKDLNSEDENIDKPRLSDILKIYDEYQKLLGEHFLDYPDLLNRTNDYYLINYIDKNFKNKPKILLNGFSQFKPPEIRFISLFAKSSLPFAIQIDYSPNNGPLFSNLEDTIIGIKDCGFSLFEMERSNTTTNDNISNSLFLRQNLFALGKANKSNNFSKFTKIFSVENKEQEVKLICKLIRELAINQNINLSDICVVARKPEEYSSLFREFFADYKITGNISDRFNLSESAVVTAIFSVLNIINYGFKRSDIHTALQSDFLNFNLEANSVKDIIDGNNLISIARQLRIHGGNLYKGEFIWKTFLSNRIKFLADSINDAKRNGNIDPTEVENKSRELKRVEKAYDDFWKIKSLLPNIKNKFSPNEFNELIKKNIIEKFEIRNILSNSFKKFIASKNRELDRFELVYKTEQLEKESRALTSFINLLDEMTNILQELQRYKKFDFLELTQRLRIAVTGAKYQISEKSGVGVTVTSVEQIRGLPYKVTILCGAIDKSFPLAYSADTFLGKELPNTKIRHIRSERMLFYQFLANNPDSLNKNEKQIYIFYPNKSEQEVHIRSPFIDSLLKITTLEEDKCFYDLTLNENKIDDSNITKWLKAISGKRELAEFIGKKTFSIVNNEKSKKVEKKLSENLFADLDREEEILSSIDFEINNKLIDFEDNYKFLHQYYSTFTQNQNSIFENSNDVIKEKIKHLKEGVFSITQLETFKDCPYKYFSNYLLNFKDTPKYEDTLSPIERGNIVHSILYAFFKLIQSEQINSNETEITGEILNKNIDFAAPVRLKRENYIFYKEILEKIARKVFDTNITDTPLQKLTQDSFFGNKNRPGYLEIWLNNEIENQEQAAGFLPSLFEVSFNLAKVKNSLNVKFDNDLKIYGKIDRIDIRKKYEEFQFIVADYKSGSIIPNNRSVINGNSFQVPLYMLAAKQLLKDYYSMTSTVEGGVYYLFFPKTNNSQQAYQYSKYLLLSNDSDISKSKKLSTSKLLNSSTDLENILTISIYSAKQVVRQISEGKFFAEPAGKISCLYCSCFSLCRIKEKHLLFREEDDDF